MKKVVYSVSRTNRFGSTKMSGLGFITESDLITACVSKKGNAYIRVFEDCVKNCHAVSGRDGEFKGAHYEIREVEFETKTPSGEHAGYDTREIEVEYSIWYKIVNRELSANSSTIRTRCASSSNIAMRSTRCCMTR